MTKINFVINKLKIFSFNNLFNLERFFNKFFILFIIFQYLNIIIKTNLEFILKEKKIVLYLILLLFTHHDKKCYFLKKIN